MFCRQSKKHAVELICSWIEAHPLTTEFPTNHCLPLDIEAHPTTTTTPANVSAQWLVRWMDNNSTLLHASLGCQIKPILQVAGHQNVQARIRALAQYIAVTFCDTSSADIIIDRDIETFNLCLMQSTSTSSFGIELGSTTPFTCTFFTLYSS